MIILKNSDAKPFLKWAGGKSQLLEQIKAYYPEKLKENKIKKYIEPFVGGGAVFFELNKNFDFEEVVLNDVNEEVILTYKVIRDNVDELIAALSKMQRDYLSRTYEQKEEMFYYVRELFNAEKMTIDYKNYSEDWVKHASKLIFLNKTCFNGIYRLNKKGEYNVPFGKRKNVTLCDEVNLRNVNLALKNVTLLSGDFEQLTDYVDENTFVYMDPPYRPLSGTSSFNDYSKEPFNDDCQIRLANWFYALDKKDASLMLSNSDPTNTDPNDTFFEDLYKKFNTSKVSASRMINSKGDGRGAISEILITNERKNTERRAANG